MVNTKDHWETIYSTKKPNEVSWTQEIPEVSLELIRAAGLPKNAAIIDIGGGDSKLVDFLQKEGYSNLSVLDISEAALNRTKERLGSPAEQVNWIVSDVTDFKPEKKYDLWHDRAAFHFLITDEQIEKYLSILNETVNPGGQVIIGTFSKNGPKKCSGLEIRQYDEESLATVLGAGFAKTQGLTLDHITPSGNTQNFLFCSFRKV